MYVLPIYVEVLTPRMAAFAVWNWSFMKSWVKPWHSPLLPVAEKALGAHTEMLAIYKPSSKTETGLPASRTMGK